MGLFTNNKKLCPVCNSPTPRIFPTSVEGMPICKECYRKIDLPDGMLKEMSIEDFRQYINFYNKNQVLRNTFTESFQSIDGYLSKKLLIDTAHGLFRLNEEEKSLVFEASNLVSFRILEDNMVLFESAGNVLKCYRSDIPKRVKAMSDEIAYLVMQIQLKEERERAERERQRERERNGEETTQSTYYSEPDIELPVPLEYFYVELTLDHPYWGEFQGKIYGPRFKRDCPSVGNYLESYERRTNKLHEMASALMQMICPGAGEVHDGADTEAPKIDAVSEIKRYKELMDSGIITEEEFAAKKRQLLGI